MSASRENPAGKEMAHSCLQPKFMSLSKFMEHTKLPLRNKSRFIVRMFCLSSCVQTFPTKINGSVWVGIIKASFSCQLATEVVYMKTMSNRSLSTVSVVLLGTTLICQCTVR